MDCTLRSAVKIPERKERNPERRKFTFTESRRQNQGVGKKEKRTDSVFLEPSHATTMPNVPKRVRVEQAAHPPTRPISNDKWFKWFKWF